MKRKTNLFYTNGKDSNFLTFSNYTEALTGDILSTDKKLFPSKFICINYEGLNNSEKKEKFIKEYLVGYYENKLAFLRDNYVNNGDNPESKIYPLNYLIETFMLFACHEDGKLTWDECNQILHHHESFSEIIKQYGNNVFSFSFVGDIVEQDYNGTYTDMVFTIGPSNNKKIELIIKQSTGDTSTVKFQDDKTYLYGWYHKDENENNINETDNTGYSEINSRLDDDNENLYYSDSLIDKLKIVNVESNIDFNIIIPLFDVVNINKTTNDVQLVENLDYIKSGEENESHIIYNVPLGIWFANKTISLNRKDTTGYAPSWSLVLSSQFKPFPYSNNIPTEIDTSMTLDAYQTFAQVLANQTNYIDLLDNYNESINKINARLSILESKINSISSVQNIDQLSQQVLDLQNNVTSQLDDMRDEIERNRIRWNVKYNK